RTRRGPWPRSFGCATAPISPRPSCVPSRRTATDVSREGARCGSSPSAMATSPISRSAPEAAMDESLLFRPIRELALGLRRRETSPVALTELALHRLETLGPRTHAVVRTLRDHAMLEAREVERDMASGHHKGLLHGIPYGAKDLLATRG